MTFELPKSIEKWSIHLIGIKGTGQCALAELLVAAGASVTGSDVDERFYTDDVLEQLGITPLPFASDSLPQDCRLAIRSAAYDNDNPVVAEVLQRGIPLLDYPQALGQLSQRYGACAISGVHGKTTTTALCGSLVRELGLPATVVVGSAVAAFGDRSTWREGDDFLIAETCEYRRHFLHFHPQRIILTSVESDHQDYYPDYASIRDAFVEFVLTLPDGGELIYCADDVGACEVAEHAAAERSDLVLTPYGVKAPGLWALKYLAPQSGENRFQVKAYENTVFSLSVPGEQIALDAVAALALCKSLLSECPPVDQVAQALLSFQGSRRRSERLGEGHGVVVMDDYGHHPTAIQLTLDGLRKFFPDRRIVVDFMPHTYSRTEALFEEFSCAFSNADVLLLHPIYASAREEYTGTVSGEQLYRATAEQRGDLPTYFCENFDVAYEKLLSELKPHDVLLTLGAGNNRGLGIRVLEFLQDQEKKNLVEDSNQ
ncbi:MAG: UDP-N-acetylmuramate--L-alanine ligase [Spirochaetales bacterium]|nr:UDP-N-acetylmuramate--L-alanine ligase [Spirochaetales bacterium]